MSELPKLMFTLGLPATAVIPGEVPTSAMCRVTGVMLGDAMEFEFDPIAALKGELEDSDFMQLGKAVAFMEQRHMGNRYASAVVMSILKGFDGEEIPERISSVLEHLEKSLIATGDFKEQEE